MSKVRAGIGLMVLMTAQAAGPDQLIRSIVDAARKGDVEGVLSGLTAESRMAVTQSFSAQAAMRQAQQEFRQALDERFGKESGTLEEAPGDLRQAVQRLAGAEILGQTPRPDGGMDIRVRTSIATAEGKTITREETLVARREGQAWKLVLGFPRDRKQSSRWKEAAERIAAEVRAGQHSDRVSAMVALDNALLKDASRKVGGAVR